MATFIVQVKDRSGNILEERVVADTQEEAKRILKKRFSSIGKIKKAGIEFDMASIEAAMSKVTVKDKAIFSRQFAVLVNAGVAIVRTLSVLAEQSGNPKFKKALMAISTDVQQGTNLSEAMAKHPECFDQLYVSMVEAGETGGVLDEVMNRLAKLLEDVARLQNQVKSAMAYPVTVGIFAVLAFLGMTIFLIPVFAGIFEGLGAELPALTQFMVDLSGFLRSPKVVLPIFGFMGAVFGFKQYYKTPMGRIQIDTLALKAPIFGDLNEKSSVARFCRVFGTLTRSGVPILQCLDIVQETISNKVISNAVGAAKDAILEGGMLSVAIAEKKVFPTMAIQMMMIGEETGELDSMMMKVADFYEDEVEQAVKALTSVIEPIMMVGIAGMVGTILLSMYLPMFAIFDQLG
ncbi:MAG: type II secretion system F family protein [Cyanobacteria bacterium]|nr:type II secretion system F family protein [Cyanobacteria bacterium CG_2015-16_32_12]NCO78651.1 type II secretion system F family protein [Cyanobacteria bacterium CG_2015-22_32_23]NCQ03147.1 type II secretion system F family protein [Cyanobacteria bacterium CG_2015-09_32_10]NCQ42513.1 type II secretion system F family protein [Cyanobacteria bacterium CG_2015-04_32_10]NCS85999.1 type II secretion system F family protein [Cyanobacteria bacterium CG_2015-02_32_10]